MTRSLGGEQSLKAEVFAASDGSQLGHCTIKGRNAATQVYGMLSFVWGGLKSKIEKEREAAYHILIKNRGRELLCTRMEREMRSGFTGSA